MYTSFLLVNPCFFPTICKSFIRAPMVFSLFLCLLPNCVLSAPFRGAKAYLKRRGPPETVAFLKLRFLMGKLKLRSSWRGEISTAKIRGEERCRFHVSSVVTLQSSGLFWHLNFIFFGFPNILSKPRPFQISPPR